MNKKTTIVLLILLLVMAGCNQPDKQTDDFITVDVTAKYPLKELILQDFMDVEYIPLETNDEFITAGYVQAISNDIILIRNTNRAGAGNIFFFDRSGKGLRKINRRGQGDGEYTNISGQITLDEYNNEMYVSCIGLRKVLVYDLLGNFKRSFAYKEGGEESGRFKNEINYDPMYDFDQDHLICQDASSGRNFFGKMEDVDMEPRNIFYIVSKQDGSITKEIQIPFKKKVSQILFSDAGIGVVRTPGLIPFQDSWLLTDPSSDTVYHYSIDHKKKPFIIRTPSIQSMNLEVFLFPGVFTDRYYFMQTVKKELVLEPQKELIKTELVYDNQENKTFECVVYNDDFTSEKPIKSLVDDLLTLTVVNNNEIAFAIKLEAFDLVEAYQKGELKGKLKEIAAGLHEESNPVIMLAKHKK